MDHYPDLIEDFPNPFLPDPATNGWDVLIVGLICLTILAVAVTALGLWYRWKVQALQAVGGTADKKRTCEIEDMARKSKAELLSRRLNALEWAFKEVKEADYADKESFLAARKAACEAYVNELRSLCGEPENNPQS